MISKEPDDTTDSSLSSSSSSSSVAASSVQQSVVHNRTTISSTSTVVPKSNSSSSIPTINLSSTTPFLNVTTEHAKGGDPSSSAAAVAVFVTVMGVAIIGMLVFIFIRRKRKLSYLPFPCDKLCMPGRKRHNSNTSFNNPLTAADDSDLVVPRERELFSIGDQDGGSDGRVRTRGRVVADDDYFYDEIFERSAFTDERTNQTNKQLTVEDFEDEFDIPDLTFRPPTTFKMN